MKNRSMKQSTKKMFSGIGIAAFVMVALVLVYAVLFYRTSQAKMVSTLAEISDQSAKVVRQEVEKNQMMLESLAILLAQGHSEDIRELVEELAAVDRANNFKRIDVYKRQLFSDKMDKVNQVMAGGSKAMIPIVGACCVLGCYSNLVLERATPFGPGTVAAVSAGALMILIQLAARRWKKRWLKDWACLLYTSRIGALRTACPWHSMA